MAKRTPFAFHVAYCEGGFTSYGWKADGRSPRADGELKQRLRHVMIQRPRSLIWAHLPVKTRQLVPVEVTNGDTSLTGDERESQFHAELDRVLGLYLDQLIENVMEKGLLFGEKVIIWCKTHNAVALVYEALQEAIDSGEYAPRLRMVNVRVWAARGGEGGLSPKQRFELARDFRRHVGGAVLVATSDSFPEAISLGPETVIDGSGNKVEYEGATVQHFAQPENQPGLALQVEDRCFAFDAKGITIYYYVPKGSLYERVTTRMIQRLDAVNAITNAPEADAAMAALRGKVESWDDQLASLLDAMPDDGEADVGTDDAGE